MKIITPWGSRRISKHHPLLTSCKISSINPPWQREGHYQMTTLLAGFSQSPGQKSKQVNIHSGRWNCSPQSPSQGGPAGKATRFFTSVVVDPFQQILECLSPVLEAVFLRFNCIHVRSVATIFYFCSNFKGKWNAKTCPHCVSPEEGELGFQHLQIQYVILSVEGDWRKVHQ